MVSVKRHTRKVKRRSKSARMRKGKSYKVVSVRRHRRKK